MIPLVDVSAAFGPNRAERAAVDEEVLAAATGPGFLSVTAPPIRAATDARIRSELLRVFELPPEHQRVLWRSKYLASNASLYRGWNPLTEGESVSHMYDLGPDLVPGVVAADGSSRPKDDGDPLLEPTPLPHEEWLPGWRAVASSYYRSMEGIGAVLMRSLARGLGLDEHIFDAPFVGGISTLRFIRYEAMQGAAEDDSRWLTEAGRRRYLLRGAHRDSGFVTLLVQDGVDGLQAQHRDGTWFDVPADEGRLVVNFGGLLERWTAGRIRGTTHRVLGTGRVRHSIPFFFEPTVDAVIAPLPGASEADGFEPFSYGDHLWESMLKFPNFHGLEGRRRPRGVPTSHVIVR